MAVQPVLTTLTVDNGAGGFRSFFAQAATQDTAAGSSVTISVQQTAGNPTSPDVPTTFNLHVEFPNTSTVVRTFSLTPGATSQDVSFFFTANGQSGGGNRCGTVELVLEAIKTTGGPTATYNLRSDTASNTPPATFTVTARDQGWIRGTTSATHALSNVSLGGAKTQPAAYDESLFHRLTLGAQPFKSETITLALSHGSLSTAVASSSTQFNATHTAVCDDRFPAASTSVTPSATIANDAFSGQPWTTFSATSDSITVDPRLTASHHFQINDSVFGLGKHDASNQMNSDEIGFLWTRFVNARGTGINGITHIMLLDPQNPGASVNISTSTSTQGGQAGWSTSPLEWTSSKPGGVWDKLTDITSPSDIDADTHLVGGADVYTLVAPNPNMRGVIRVSASDTQTEDHLKVGDTLEIEFHIRDTEDQMNLEADISPPPEYNLTRVTGSGSARKAQHWTGLVWQDTGAGAIDTFAMTQSTADPRIWFASVPVLSGSDFTVVVRALLDGFPLTAMVPVEVVGTANQHDGYRTQTALGGLLGLSEELLK